MKKIVIAADSFKGSLTSSQVADAVAEGGRSIYPSAAIVKVNVADGGEGTTEAILSNTDGERVTVSVNDPLGRRIEAVYGLINSGSTAVIETAAASGLSLLAPEERNPLIASTFGTGEMIADALRKGCRKFMIGLGGSATNDGGLGMMSALGYRFIDSYGNVLHGCGASLRHVASVDDSTAIEGLSECTFVIACDVDNPLFGPSGAAYVFSPQKGADEGMVEELDEGLRNFSNVMKSYSGRDVSSTPGSGAAGGLGAAFMTFTKCRLTAGIEMILDAVGFDELIKGADLIITGEGKIDMQTAMGKVPSGILKRARNQGIRTLAIGGLVEECNLPFDDILQITPAGMPIEVAMQPEVAKANIRKSITDFLASHELNHRTRP